MAHYVIVSSRKIFLPFVISTELIHLFSFLYFELLSRRLDTSITINFQANFNHSLNCSDRWNLVRNLNWLQDRTIYWSLWNRRYIGGIYISFDTLIVYWNLLIHFCNFKRIFSQSSSRVYIYRVSFLKSLNFIQTCDI